MRNFVCLLLLCSLSACVMYPRDVNIALRDEGRVDIDAMIGSDEAVAKDMSKGPKERNAEAQRRADAELENFRQCVGGNVSINEKKESFNVSLRDVTAGQVERSFRCAEGLDDLVDFKVSQIDGWLWNTTLVKLDFLVEDDGNPGEENFSMALPDRIAFEFPGSGEVEVVSTSESIDATVTEKGSGAVEVTFAQNAAGIKAMHSRQNIEKDCEKAGAKSKPVCPFAEPYYSQVRLAAYSSEANLPVWFALLLGALLLGGGGYYISRRT